MRSVAFAVAFAAVDTNNQFLASAPVVIAEPQDKDNQVQETVEEISQEIVNAADVNGNGSIGKEELQQVEDAANQMLQKGLAGTSQALNSLKEDMGQQMAEFAKKMDGFSAESVQKALEEGQAPQPIQDAILRVFAQLDQNGDATIDGIEAVTPVARMMREAILQSSALLKQFQEQVPDMMAGFIQQMNSLDRDQDGNITSDEVVEAVKAAQEEVEDAAMQAAFEEYDMDVDADDEEESENEDEDEE